VWSQVRCGCRLRLDHTAFANLYGCKIGDGTRIGPFVEVQRGDITISENAVPAHLRSHPKDFLGSCGAGRPQGAKPNVCVRLGSGKFVAIWVPAGKVPAYLRRNYLSHRTRTGTC
jgi:hypothetical protein